MAEGLLVIRVVVGVLMAAHGLQKLFGWWNGTGVKALGEGFERSGYSPGLFFAAVASVSELVSGVLLASGFLTILGAAMLTGVMVNALSMHWSNGLWITNKGYEYTLVLGAVAIGLGFTGPGRLSIDAALGLDVDGIVPGLIAALVGLGAGFATLAWRQLQRGHRATDAPAVPRSPLSTQPRNPSP